MADLIGIIDPLSFPSAMPKQWYLAFDRIASPRLNTFDWEEQRRLYRQDSDVPAILDELKHLQDKGFLSHVEVHPPKNRSEELISAAHEQLRHANSIDFAYWRKQMDERGDDARKSFVLEVSAWSILAGESFARLASLALNASTNDNYVPIFDNDTTSYAAVEGATRRVAVMRVVMNELPVPSAETPWQQLYEFKNDEATTRQRLRLRNWVRKVATTSSNERDIEDELRATLADYEEHMNLHKLKTQTSRLEWAITTLAELAELTVRFKFSAAAKKLFSLRQKEIDLSENEMKAPGREVAYIANAKSKFD